VDLGSVVRVLSGVQSVGNLTPNQIDRPEDAPSTAGLYTDIFSSVGVGAWGAKTGLMQDTPGSSIFGDSPAMQRSEKGAAKFSVTPILDYALASHLALSLLNGFSTTEKGTAIGGGQGWYEAAQGELNGAKAGSGTEWEGRAAEDYSSRNTEQFGRVGRMAQADKDLVAAVREQGFDVERLRSDFGGVKTALNAAVLIAVNLYWTNPITGPTTSMQFQAVVAQSCLHVDVLLQSLQGDRAAKNAKELTRIVNEYRALTQEATTALPYHS